MRALEIDPIHDTRGTFRAVLMAISRPGTVQETPTDPADLGVVATLVDHEVGFHTDDNELEDAIRSEGRLNRRPLEDAAVVHVKGSTDGRILNTRRGTLKEPSLGATVIYRTERLSEGKPSADGPMGIEVRGPGVPGSRSLTIVGLPESEFEAIAEIQAAYPRGADVILTAGNRVAALPRSVGLEVA